MKLEINLDFLSKIPFTKRLVISTSIGVTLAASAMMTFGMSWIATLAVSSLISLISYEAMTQFKMKMKSERQKLDQNPKEWIDNHQAGYTIGYGSNNWVPYMCSFFKTQSYKDYSAYKIGLEEAKAGRPLRLKA